MKICPKCNQTFSDSALFCSTDGGKLQTDTSTLPEEIKTKQYLDPFCRFEIEEEVERSRVVRKELVLDKELGKKAWAVIYTARTTKLIDRKKIQKLMQLSHPNLVRTLTCNSNEQGELYIVYEFVEGQELSQMMAAGIEFDKALRLAEQFISCVGAFHQQGLFHGQLNPNNVLVESSLLGPGYVRVLNPLNPWNLKLPDDLDSSSATVQMVFKYLRHQAPELARGEEPNATVDIYSASMMLAEMVLGREFPGRAMDLEPLRTAELVGAQIDKHGELPANFGRIIRKGLDLSPAKRYQDGKQLLGDLAELMEQPLPQTVSKTQTGLLKNKTRPLSLSNILDPYGRFEIKEEVESSAICSRLKIFDNDLKRDVSAVVYSVKASSLIDQDKAQRLMQIRHPNLVQVLAFNRTLDDRIYVVYENIVGRSLKQLIKEGLSLKSAIFLLLQVVDCLIAFHKEGLFHGDINPNNIIIEADASSLGHAMVLNTLNQWNLKISEDLDPSRPTVSMVFSELCYQPPECAIEENGKVSPAVDVFAMTLVLAEMVLGPNFPRKEMDNLANQLSKYQLVEPLFTMVNEPVRSDLLLLLRRGLANKAQERYQNAEDLREDIKILAELVVPLSAQQKAFDIIKSYTKVTGAVLVISLVIQGLLYFLLPILYPFFYRGDALQPEVAAVRLVQSLPSREAGQNLAECANNLIIKGKWGRSSSGFWGVTPNTDGKQGLIVSLLYPEADQEHRAEWVVDQSGVRANNEVALGLNAKLR